MLIIPRYDFVADYTNDGLIVVKCNAIYILPVVEVIKNLMSHML